MLEFVKRNGRFIAKSALIGWLIGSMFGDGFKRGVAMQKDAFDEDLGTFSIDDEGVIHPAGEGPQNLLFKDTEGKHRYCHFHDKGEE